MRTDDHGSAVGYSAEDRNIGGEGTRTVFFEEDTFESLGENVRAWMADHPDREVLSLSHAVAVRNEKRYDKVSFGWVEPVNYYSAMLLVRS